MAGKWLVSERSSWRIHAGCVRGGALDMRIRAYVPGSAIAHPAPGMWSGQLNTPYVLYLQARAPSPALKLKDVRAIQLTGPNSGGWMSDCRSGYVCAYAHVKRAAAHASCMDSP